MFKELSKEKTSVREKEILSSINDNDNVVRIVDDSPTNRKNQAKSTKNGSKTTYGEYGNVRLAENEYLKLAEEFTAEKRDEAIKFLDEYIEEKNYKSKSHYLAIRRWVFDAVEEKKRKSAGFGSTKQNGTLSPGQIMEQRLMALESNKA